MESSTDVTIVDLRVHPGHRGFVVGGRRASIVVKVIGSQDSRVLVETDQALDARILIKQGWKALACDGIRSQGDEVLRAAGLARREGRDCLISFEVDADTVRHLGWRIIRKQLARRELTETFGNRSLEQLDELSRTEKAHNLRSLRVQWHVGDASAVLEVEVLLNRKSGKAMQLSNDIFVAAKRGDYKTVVGMVEHTGFSADIFLQRDGGGNVVLHHAATLPIAKFLAEHEPSAKTILNAQGQVPLLTYLRRCPEESDVLESLAVSDSDVLLQDINGMSAAMIAQGPGRVAFEAQDWLLGVSSKLLLSASLETSSHPCCSFRQPGDGKKFSPCTCSAKSKFGARSSIQLAPESVY